MMVLGAAGSATANVVYTYQGNNFDSFFSDLPPEQNPYDATMSISGSFELATALPANLAFTEISSDVLDFSFDDGVHTYTKANSPGQCPPGDVGMCFHFSVSTDAAGTIELWNVGSEIPLSGDRTAGFTTQDFIAAGGVRRPGDQAIIRFATGSVQLAGVALDPGNWTLVPEPSTGLLLGWGLVALALRRRR